NTYNIIIQALQLLQIQPEIHDVQVSRFYQTTPVSSIVQNDFINAVCRFKTSLKPLELLKILQTIELKLGKLPKPKDAPRCLDCDILFYGQEKVSTPELEIPHPHWRERLFVLKPLSDLVDVLHVPGIPLPLSLKIELQQFNNVHREIVTLI